MEHIRKYLEDESISSCPLEQYPSGTIAEDDSNAVDVENVETPTFLGSSRIDGRSSDTKSIGSLSQHFFESDDNEDEKYYGTCNGYNSHPGSKSNLLLCTECDLKSRTCTYRPQTPSHYGRFVEERIDRQLELTKVSGSRHQLDRRGSTISSSLLRSPMKVEGSPRYYRDDTAADRNVEKRRSKSISSTSTTIVAIPRQHLEQEEKWTLTQECKRDLKHRRQELRSPGAVYKSPVKATERSPRSNPNLDQRVWIRRQDQTEQEASEDQDYFEESEDSPPCPICNGSNGISRCAHCNFSSDQDDGDLICFRCQMSAEEETTSYEGSVCPKCENNYGTRIETNGSCRTTSSSSEGAKYPVDAVVKIQLNNRSIDVDSDDTIDSDPSNNRDSGDPSTGCAGSIDRLATIVEAKNDTASENGEENGSKINGQPRTKYLNYMIVLLL